MDHGGFMFKKALAVATVLTSMVGYTCTEDGTKGILPENDLWISADTKAANNMTKERFNAVIDKVEKIYEPIIAGMNGKLSIARNWDDGTVNAYAQRSGRTYKVSMFGGLARHEAITEDGFALVVCHEIGHHIGGAPKKGGWFGGWASNEGQSDYWATAKCLRKVFRAEPEVTENTVNSMDVPDIVVKKCAEIFSDKLDQLICQRGSMAGMSTAKLFQALRNSDVEPDFAKPDPAVATRTDHSHPATQCRLDTYYQGALCSLDEMIDTDQGDESVGVCYRKAGDTDGIRPLCWFKPKS